MFAKLVEYIQELYSRVHSRVRNRWMQPRRPLPDESVYVHIVPPRSDADEFVIQLEPAI